MYKENPKTKGSGVVCVIPQTGVCPVGCSDCFFQSGRSFLEPLENNLPNLIPTEDTKHRVVRVNDGNDSSNCFDVVRGSCAKYEDKFYNTSMIKCLDDFDAPFVLTVNPGEMTDKSFHILEKRYRGLMFVRFRLNAWNVDMFASCVRVYNEVEVPVVATIMAYYNDSIQNEHKDKYEYKKRTLNSYYVLKQTHLDDIMATYEKNPLVYVCGYKGTYSCSRCGNCVREYYNAMERLRL